MSFDLDGTPCFLLQTRANAGYFSSMFFLKKAGLIFACAVALAVAFTRLPSPLNAQETPFLSEELSARQKRMAEMTRSAQLAMNFGLGSLAEMMAKSVISSPDSSAEDLANARKTLITSLISQGNFELAKAQLDDASDNVSDDYNLMRTLTAIGLNDVLSAEYNISKTLVAKLSEDMRSWYYSARGYIFYMQGKFDSAEKNFRRAQELAVTKYALADAQMAQNLARLTEGLDDGQLTQMAQSLSEKVNIYLGTQAGFGFAKQYAIVLNRLGRDDDALKVIDDQLQLPLISDSDAEDLKVISALILSPKPDRCKPVLRSILMNTKSPDTMEYCLKLLRACFAQDVAGLSEMLKDILKNGAESVRDRILLELSYCAVQSANTVEASKFANELLENYPGSQFKKDALRILTWVVFANLDGDTTKYRLAANYLLNISALETSPETSAHSKMLAADCYFKDRDFDEAGTIYESLLSSGLPKADQGEILGRAVESFMDLGDYKKALALLDAAYSSDNFNSDEIWRAEWILLTQLRAKGRTQEAADRIDAILAAPSKMKVGSVLRMRMLFLQAKMAEEAGEHPKSVSLCDKLMAEISGMRILEDAQKTMDELAASTLLLKAKSLSRLGKDETEGGAFETYALLREKYPSTEAAHISSLYQARSLASLGKYAAAAQLCKALSDNFPLGKYASIALFEAAQFERQIGSDASYKNALAMLDKLCKEYPSDGKVFYARLMEGDILRILNMFADARSMYLDVIANFPSHPEVYLASMALGDSFLAQSNKELDASATFERLYALSSIPFEARSEAAFKWGFALNRMNRKREASEVWWITSRDLLSANTEPSVNGKYWIGRMLMELGKNLEELGQKTDARRAYEMVAENNLSGAPLARKKLKPNQ